MITEGDCIEVMAGLEADSIDAIVTDPPYDLTSGRVGTQPRKWRAPGPATPVMQGLGKGFMGKTWDGTGIAFEVETWAEMYRIAKPGAYLLAFGSPRTFHRMMVAIEDAGWEIRDTLVWAYAQGFPKSRNIAKDIDRLRGAEREVVGSQRAPGMASTNVEQGAQGRSKLDFDVLSDVAITSDAQKWEGWGTALKPSWEPIVMARKPHPGSIAANVLLHGTGALNIDAARLPTDENLNGGTYSTQNGRERASAHPGDTREQASAGSYGMKADRPFEQPPGRWPANVILTDPIFDGGIEGVVGGGETTSGKPGVKHGGNNGFAFGAESRPSGTQMSGFGDTGTYSRFFLVPKAGPDREPILSSLPKERVASTGSAVVTAADWGSPDEKVYTRQTARQNTHPTVKPVELMRHLVRLVTPRDGIVLDPFLGSGTTGLAAELEGYRWMGIEREHEYVLIAEDRLNWVQRGLAL